jgi:hypothetical protein
MNKYVALIADATGRYAFVFVEALSWDEAIDQLEDVGCEVIEDQTDEYESEDLEKFTTTANYRAEYGVCTISELVRNPDFIAHN